MNSGLLIGQILALLTAFCWGENSIIFSYLGKEVNSSTIVHLRMWIALPLVIIIALIFEDNFFLQANLNNWICLLLSGFIGYFLCDSLLFWAFANWGARETMVVMTLSPIFNAILSYFFFEEILTLLQIIAISITILGIIILVLSETHSKDLKVHATKTKGIIFAFTASILQAISNILAKGALCDVGPMGSNSIRLIGGFTAVVTFSIFFRKSFKKDFEFFTNKKYLGLLLIASISGPALGMTMMLFAFDLAPVGLVTAIVQTSPIFILLYDLVFLKKHLKILEILGTVISVLGVILMFV